MGRYDSDDNRDGLAQLVGKIEQLTSVARASVMLPNGNMALLAPDGYTPHIYPATPIYTAPHHIKAAPVFAEAKGFNAYVNQFKRIPASRIFADLGGLRLTAVLDYHEANTPGTLDHTATLAMRTTPSWDAWNAKNGVPFGQLDFAEFIEEHADDIMAPAAADLLEMIENFQDNRTVTFQSKVNRQNGSVRLAYVDEEDARSTGSVKIPERLKLSFGVFEGQSVSQIDAFVRTKVDGGKLLIAFKLHKIGEVKRLAFDEVCRQVEEAAGIEIAAGSMTGGRFN